MRHVPCTEARFSRSPLLPFCPAGSKRVPEHPLALTCQRQTLTATPMQRRGFPTNCGWPGQGELLQAGGRLCSPVTQITCACGATSNRNGQQRYPRPGSADSSQPKIHSCSPGFSSTQSGVWIIAGPVNRGQCSPSSASQVAMRWGLLHFLYAALGILLSTAGQTLLVRWAPQLLQAGVSPPSPTLVTVPPLSASLLTPAACACAAPAALCPLALP